MYLKIRAIILKLLNKDCTMSRIHKWDVLYPDLCPPKYVKLFYKDLKGAIKDAEIAVYRHRNKKKNVRKGIAEYFLEKFIQEAKCVIRLYNSKFYNEMFIASGYLLEGFVNFYYIIKTRRANDFLDYKKIQDLKYYFLTNSNKSRVMGNNEQQNIKNTLQKYGMKFIVKNKKNDDIIKQLLSPNIPNEAKYTILTRSYSEYYFKDTINSIMRTLNLPPALRQFYTTYCAIKHYNNSDIYFCSSCKKYTFMPLSKMHQGLSLQTAALILRLAKLEYNKLYMDRKYKTKYANHLNIFKKQ